MTYRATVIGYDHDLLGPVWFQIRVVSSGPAAQVHFTWHRFNAFKHLAEYLRHRCPDLPSLQPRGHLWERAVKVVNYSVFLKERQQSLTAFLQAVLVADPTVEDVLLREFLHLPSDGAYPRTEDELRNVDECDRPRSCSSMDKFMESHRDRQRCSTGDFGVRLEQEASSCRKRCASLPLVSLKDEEPLAETEDQRFSDHAVIIARDVARVFPSHHGIHHVRLEIAEVLRAYARQDPDLGYTQGMCFAAGVVCLKSGASLEEKVQRFSELMKDLRDLWMPGFPLVEQGVPALESMLASKDPELLHHLYHNVKLDLGMVVPGAWLSIFGKWLPVEVLEELVPFLQHQGLPGFVVVTFLILLAHRDKLLAARSLEEILPRINGFSSEPAPDHLLLNSEVSVHQLQSGRDSVSWIAAM